MTKRELGQFYTKGNPFGLHVFKEWTKKAGLWKNEVLEPFAGANDIIRMLAENNFPVKYKSYDIAPNNKNVLKRDTLLDFPKNFEVCITNPPWLAKNSATRRKIPFPKTNFDDMYKFALAKCLSNCSFVAAIVPESFITSGLFKDRLKTVISLTSDMFNDTDHPVCLALFEPLSLSNDVLFYRNNSFIGKLDNLKQYLPKNKKSNTEIKFNDPDGNIGFIAIDNCKEASIRFCDPKELGDYIVRQSCRSITKIKTDLDVKINDLNDYVSEFRNDTKDVFLTAFKGLRKDGWYRRRMDYALTRRIILNVKIL